MIQSFKTSSLTKKSCDLVYEFYKNNAENTNENLLFIGLPRKYHFSFLIAIKLLTILFKHDLDKVKINTHLKTLKQGDKIEFFGEKRAEFIRYSNKYILFYARGYEYFGSKRIVSKVRCKIPLVYGNYLKKYTGNAKTYHTLSDILKTASEKRGTISAKEKLLLENKNSRNLGVPSGLLKSKVLLISGRGNKNKLDRLSKQIKIYGESIQSIFGSNLIIEKSLENYENIFSASATAERINYDKHASKLLWELANEYPELEVEILKLIIEFERGNYSKQDLLDLKNDVKILYNKEPSVFEVLIGRLPEESITLPTGLKLVIINSLEVVQNYQRVIKGFKELGIKVVCTFDLYDLSYSNPFPNSPKYFWNRKKISLLARENKQYFEKLGSINDKHIWNRALTYSKRKYTINLYDDDRLAELYWKIYRYIRVIDGKEKLVELFWTKIHPLYYLFKNSPNLKETTRLEYLKPLANDLRNITTDGSTIEKLFVKFINRAKGFENNKTLNKGQILSQEINLDSESLSIPYNTNKKSLKFFKNIESYKYNLIIPGIPFKEFQLKLIDDLVKSCYAQNLNFLCWQSEYSYLKNLIHRVEESDWLEDNSINKLAEYAGCSIKIESKNNIVTKDYRKEIISIDEDDVDYEEVDQKQSTYYHSKFEGELGAYTKKSVTAYLQSNKWIYIPLNDYVYYFNRRENTINKKKGSELNKSDTLVLFNISKEDIRTVGSSNEDMDQVVKDLEVWSDALRTLYNNSGKSYYRLEKRLRPYVTEARPNANPNRINLMRWLDDNDLTLAPWKDNLGVILEAAGLYHKKQRVLSANKKIRTYERIFKSNIRREVFKRVDEFKVKEDEIITKEIFVDGVSVEVTTCKVLNIDKEKLNIDNRYVKKIV